MYNLADSELLARIVRYKLPHIEFVRRVRATFGLDYISLGREKVDFSGAMVQSTKSVEAPLLYSKIRVNRFQAAGKNFTALAMVGCCFLQGGVWLCASLTRSLCCFRVAGTLP